MAWKEQCQIAFKANANALLHKRGGKGIVKVMKQLSKESGIPYETLKWWYYPHKKNGEESPKMMLQSALPAKSKPEKEKKETESGITCLRVNPVG